MTFDPPRHYSALDLPGQRFIFVAKQPHGTGILIMRQSESVFYNIQSYFLPCTLHPILPH